MQPISKSEMNYLIQKNILRQSKGNYGDKLVVTGKFSSKRGKQRYITDPLYNYLTKLKQQEILEPDKIKENQRYLFSNNFSVS